MLPDYPKIKERLSKVRFELMQASVKNSHLLGKIKRIILHEGDRGIIIREDGSCIEVSLKKEEVKIKIPTEYITSGNQERISELFLEATGKLRGKITKSVFDSVSESVDAVGNTVDIKGEPLKPEHIFELFEKIQLDFDSNGNIKEGFAFYFHPDSMDIIGKVFQEISTDPNLHEKFMELLARKRMEFRDRESNRKLVG